MKRIAPYRKAVAAGVVAFAAALAVVVTGNESLGDVTLAEWLGVVIATLAASGVVYAVPNKP